MGSKDKEKEEIIELKKKPDNATPTVRESFSLKVRENEKTIELRKKLNDNSLTLRERREISEELKRERYALDKRRPISSRTRLKIAALCCIPMMLPYIVGAITVLGGASAELFWAVMKADAVVLLGLFVLATVVFTFFKREPADEETKHESLLANRAAAWTTGALTLFSAHLAGHLMPDVISISSAFFVLGAYFLVELYISLYLIAFLLIDIIRRRKDKDENGEKKE